MQVFHREYICREQTCFDISVFLYVLQVLCKTTDGSVTEFFLLA